MALRRLLFYNARYYDATIGRFISADTIVPGANGLTVWPSDSTALSAWKTAGSGPANPQELNRYSYVSNDPLTRTDPTGHLDCGGECADEKVGGPTGGGDGGGSGGGSGSGEGSGKAPVELENPLPPGSTMESDGSVHPTIQADPGAESAESLADKANTALMELPRDLRRATVGAASDPKKGMVYSIYHRTTEGTADAVEALRNKGYEVLDAPTGRGPAYHAERQLYRAGYTDIGISRQKGMCGSCTKYFSSRPNVTITPYKKFGLK